MTSVKTCSKATSKVERKEYVFVNDDYNIQAQDMINIQ